MSIVITPLGTVSPYPKGSRNCPGFLVEYEGRKILLDCGCGAVRALDFPAVLEGMHVVVTHYHKDHFSDLGALQYASFVYHNLGLLQEKIKVYLPEKEFAFNRQAIVANAESYADYIGIADGAGFSIGDLKVSFEDSRSHSIESFMVKLQTRDRKVVYTSDVGVSRMDALAAFCENADLLICESSFLRKHRPAGTTHMTAFAAGELAARAGVKKLLLTHFWPEEDPSLYVEEASLAFPGAGAAEEGKKIVIA